MPNRPILFSVAHSSVARGAISEAVHVDEYTVSRRASETAFDALAGDFPCALVDVGPFKPSEYDDHKVAMVNALRPRLGVEIHCNASGTNLKASYSEVIYHAESAPGREAAAVIARTLAAGFANGQHRGWLTRGARPNTVKQDGHLMFFLERTAVPCVIVEGLFISNEEQAAWLADGGAAAYGFLVAEGIKRWLGGAKA